MTTYRWRDHAACKGLDPALFYPGPGEDLAPALAICRRCEVREPCLEHALTRGECYGIWGGESEHRRRVIRAQRRAAASEGGRRVAS